MKKLLSKFNGKFLNLQKLGILWLSGVKVTQGHYQGQLKVTQGHSLPIIIYHGTIPRSPEVTQVTSYDVMKCPPEVTVTTPTPGSHIGFQPFGLNLTLTRICIQFSKIILIYYQRSTISTVESKIQ